MELLTCITYSFLSLAGKTANLQNPALCLVPQKLKLKLQRLRKLLFITNPLILALKNDYAPASICYENSTDRAADNIEC